MAGNEAFTVVQGRGWQRGMSNLLHGEFSSWFGRRRWLRNSLIWVLLVDGILLMVLLQARMDPEFSAASADRDLVALYTIFGGMFVAVGVVIAMQGEIVGEKRSGTAAWVLSKPVSRPAFVLSKVIGNGLGLLFTAVLIPGVIAYLLYSLVYFQELIPVGGFLAAMGILGLNAIFWITFTLMLGTFFHNWGPVIAIPMALLFGQ
ncbi:MAG: ABC transporter permease, partial [Anaerolineales bacterium]